MSEETRRLSDEELAKLVDKDDAARLAALEAEAARMRSQMEAAGGKQEKDSAGQ